jgi:hypothetical protein
MTGKDSYAHRDENQSHLESRSTLPISSRSSDPYRYQDWLQELSMTNGTSSLGLELNEEKKLCVCFATDATSGRIIEQLDDDCITCIQRDMDEYPPYYFRILPLA